jgi:protein-tyrosine phosphatase
MKAPIYWIEGPWPARLAIVPRPRGGDWLADDIAAWKQSAINVVVSTLTPDEVADFELHHEQTLCEQNGLQWFSFPIADRGVPTSTSAALAMLRPLERKLAEGKTVAVHCRQGIGRSALVAAGLLALGGVGVQSAFERISAARGCGVPETQEQRDWVSRFAREIVAVMKT